MSVTSMTSAKAIVARVVRSCGGKLPGHYQDDVLEWIPHAMKMLRTRYELTTASTPNFGCAGELISQQHTIKLPCGIVSILAVEDESGRKVMYGSDITDLRTNAPTTQFHIGSKNAIEANAARSTNFQIDVFQTSGVDPANINTDGTATPIKGQDIIPSPDQDRQSSYYTLNGPYMQTSQESMFIKIHFLTLPVDKEGYPMIPDNEHYIQACQWFVLRELIGSGYEHKLWKGQQGWSQCDTQWEREFAFAVGEITYPSIDRMERLRTWAERLVPPRNLAEDFFVSSGKQNVFY